MRLSFSILISLFFSRVVMGQGPAIQWIEQFGNVGEEYAFGIAVDDSSNTFVTGLLDANDSSIHNKAQCVSHDIFVARYDIDGNLQWLNKLGATGTNIAWGITLDNNHDIYSVSTFQDTLNLSTDTLISKGFMDILITKYNTQGTLLWAKSAGGLLGDYGYGIATDSQNNVYIAGSFFNTADFGGISLTSHGHSDVFLAKYDSSGNIVWAIDAGGSATDDAEGYAITIDRSDNIYLTGKFGATAVFSSDTLVSKGSYDIFTSKYNASGILQWIKQSGGAGLDLGQGIKADANGSIYVTGYFSGNGIFNGDTLSSKGNSDIFISKYDAPGNFMWTKSAGGTGNDEGAGIALDRNNKVYVAGYFTSSATFGASILTSQGMADAFLACLDSTGNFQWTKQGGGLGNDAASSLCVDTSNAVYISGSYNYVSTFDSFSVNSVGDANFFVAKYGYTTPFSIQENESAEKNLIIYPNPTAGPVSILLKENKTYSPLKIRLMNSVGQLAYEKELRPCINENNIDLSHLTNGIYLLELTNGAKIIQKKIVLLN